MSEDKITAALGLSKIEYAEVVPTEEQQVELIESVVAEQAQTTEAQKEVLDDIDYAKSNIKDALEKATEAYDELIKVAKMSDTARTYEVASTMLKSIVDANKEFVLMSEKKKFAKEELPSTATDEGKTVNNTQNNLYISTTDFLKMIKGSNDDNQ